MRDVILRIQQWWIRHIILPLYKKKLYFAFKKNYIAFVGFKPICAGDDDSILAKHVLEKFGCDRLTWIAWISSEDQPIEYMGGPKG